MKTKTTAQVEKGVRVRPVVGFEGYYEVTDDGRVWSVPRVTVMKNGVLRNVPGGWRKVCYDGNYMNVCLKAEGTYKSRLVHILVAEAFLGPRPKGLDVDHIDRNKTNNRASNLRYNTRSENNHNSAAKGFHWDKVNKRYKVSIMVRRKNYELGRFDTIKEARAAYIAVKKFLGLYTP